MSIVPLLLLCSLALVALAVLLFVFSAKQGDCDEADRLCLMPLDDDAESSRPAERRTFSSPETETETETR